MVNTSQSLCKIIRYIYQVQKLPCALSLLSTTTAFKSRNPEIRYAAANCCKPYIQTRYAISCYDILFPAILKSFCTWLRQQTADHSVLVLMCPASSDFLPPSQATWMPDRGSSPRLCAVDRCTLLCGNTSAVSASHGRTSRVVVELYRQRQY